MTCTNRSFKGLLLGIALAACSLLALAQNKTLERPRPIKSLPNNSAPLGGIEPQIKITGVVVKGSGEQRGIEVRWDVKTPPNTQIIDFDVEVKATYTDGFNEVREKKASSDTRDTAFVVPAEHKVAFS